MQYMIKLDWKYSKGVDLLSRSQFMHFTESSCYFHHGSRRGRDRMVVGFTTTYTISAYHH